jgi:integrase/recombinase XerD
VLQRAVLHLFRRHYPPCPHTSRRYRRCNCPLWVQGSLGGEWIKKSLNVTSWEAASDLVTAWTSSGQIGVVRPDIPPLKEAVEKFLADAKAQQLNWETIRKYETFLERRFLPWCESKGYRLLKQITPSALVEFRKTWQDGALYATKNIERLRSFFRFCERMKWASENPALALKAPKVTTKPTLPFTVAEMNKVLAACDKYRGDKARIKAFILVMRYSGLRIGDTITLRRDQLTGNDLFLYTQKTGQPVRVPLPDFVVKALLQIENESDDFFWTGKNIRSAVANWSRYLTSVFDLANVKHGHSHRFRDTFATGLLLAGVPIEDVSILLGHSNTRITAKHYSPWVKERQQKLEERVKQAWRLTGSAQPT